jgi:hypothetical protein
MCAVCRKKATALTCSPTPHPHTRAPEPLSKIRTALGQIAGQLQAERWWGVSAKLHNLGQPGGWMSRFGSGLECLVAMVSVTSAGPSKNVNPQ